MKEEFKNKCNRHPKYKGNKMPKYQCNKCLSIYLLLNNKPRVLPMPTKVIPDKTKYNRKRSKGADHD